jgi:integrase/recombinase XerD
MSTERKTYVVQPKHEQFIKERSLLHNVSPATAEWHRQSLNWLKVEQPTQEDLNNFVFRMRERNLSPASCNNRIRSVNAYLKWAGSVLRCTKLKEPCTVMPTYTPGQVTALLTWKPAHKNFYQRRLSLLVCMLFDCGLRISEALTLHRYDCDMENMLLLVTGKGNKQRRTPFSFELRKRLYRFCADFSIQENMLLFSTRDHTRLDKNVIRRDVKLLCQSLGFAPPKRVLHSFRHTFGAHYVRSGGDVFRLQKMLGHETLEMSRKYASLNTADLSSVHERLSLLG